MTTYLAHLTHKPIITASAHVFRIAVSIPSTLIPPPAPTAIITLEFHKLPTETWPTAQARAYQEIADAIATYEQELALSLAAGAWLKTQQWQTP